MALSMPIVALSSTWWVPEEEAATTNFHILVWKRTPRPPAFKVDTPPTELPR